MRGILAALLGGVFFICGPAYSTTDPLTQEALIGSWVLHYDPDGAPKDYLDFYRDSSVDIRGDDGDHFICRYSVSDSVVSIVCQVRGQERILRLHGGKDTAELVNADGALYWKTPDNPGSTYGNSGWSTYSSKDAKFSVLFFGVPSIQSETLTSRAGEGRAMHFTSKFPGGMYMINAVTLPEGIASDESLKQAYEKYEGILLQNLRQFAKANDTFTVDRAEDFVIQGSRARRVQATVLRTESGKGNLLNAALLIRSGMFYQLTAIVPKQEGPNKAVTDFFASFIPQD